ncbi:signal peptidase I [Candidatus Woesearchaeota archaeon]|nr:signal peptidase I [Candidatus Woesearchaeota archaeon]
MKLFIIALLLVVSVIASVSVVGFELYRFNSQTEQADQIADLRPNPVLLSGRELPSPSDWIKEEQITVLKDRVVIHLDNPAWARFADTNSMDPLIDIGAHGIELKPQKPEQINVGDVIAYQTEDFEGVVVHRVREIGTDEQGHYFITKGDNNNVDDGIRIRFEQIKGVLVAVIW